MIVDFNIHGISTFGAKLPLATDVHSYYSNLLPENLNSAAPARKQEFVAGRYCAVKASHKLGFDLKSLPVAKTREPIWPKEIIGSISHSKTLALSCISLVGSFASLGIDAEEVLENSIAEDIQNTISTAKERTILNKFSFNYALTILFSAKEALYKALYPLTHEFIDFKEVKLWALDTENRTFSLSLDSPNIKLTNFLGTYQGSFQQVENTIVTLVAIPIGKGEYVYS